MTQMHVPLTWHVCRGTCHVLNSMCESQRLDQGHNAFWATILMHHSFLDRGLDGAKMTRRKWLELIRRAQARPGKVPSDPSLGATSPRDTEYDVDVVLPSRNGDSTGPSGGADAPEPLVTRSIQSWFNIIERAREMPERAHSENYHYGHREIPLLPLRGLSTGEIQNTGPLPMSMSAGPSQTVPRQLDTVFEDDGSGSHR